MKNKVPTILPNLSYHTKFSKYGKVRLVKKGNKHYDSDNTRYSNVGKNKLSSRKFLNASLNDIPKFWCGQCKEQSINLNTDRVRERDKFIIDEFGMYGDKIISRKIDFIIRHTDYQLGYNESSYWSCDNGCEITLPDDTVVDDKWIGDDRVKDPSENHGEKVGYLDMDTCLIFETEYRMRMFLEPPKLVKMKRGKYVTEVKHKFW